jgi:hypothetical protein
VGLTLTTDNGTQFTSTRFLETLARLGITHRHTAYHHPEGNSYIKRFHRSLKEEEVGLAEYRNLEEARESIWRYLGEYNGDRPHRGLRSRTPREAYISFETDLNNQALSVQFWGRAPLLDMVYHMVHPNTAAAHYPSSQRKAEIRQFLVQLIFRQPKRQRFLPP